MPSAILALALSAALTCTMWPTDTSPTVVDHITVGSDYVDGYIRVVVATARSTAASETIIVVQGHRAGMSYRASDFEGLAREMREFTEAARRYRARAVPPGRLHGKRELRVEAPLPERRHPGRRVPRAWLAGRQGQARERKPPRARRRLRTWERA